MLVPIRRGTSMAAGNQQKHLSLSFATKRKFISRGTKKQYSTTFSNSKHRLDSQISRNKFRNKSLFNQLGRLVNTASPKSSEIQAWSITKPRTNSEQKLAWILVFSCSYTSLK